MQVHYKYIKQQISTYLLWWSPKTAVILAHRTQYFLWFLKSQISQAWYFKDKKRYIELTLFATKFHKHLLSNSFTDSGLMQKIVPLWF